MSLKSINFVKSLLIYINITSNGLKYVISSLFRVTFLLCYYSSVYYMYINYITQKLYLTVHNMYKCSRFISNCFYGFTLYMMEITLDVYDDL